jgi:hypothetical protein
MSDKQVTMRRGKVEDNDIAVVREDWVEEWKSYGYKVVKVVKDEPPADPEPTPA